MKSFYKFHVDKLELEIHCRGYFVTYLILDLYQFMPHVTPSKAVPPRVKLTTIRLNNKFIG